MTVLKSLMNTIQTGGDVGAGSGYWGSRGGPGRGESGFI